MVRPGSNVVANCPICGIPRKKAGLSGHLRFKHGVNPKDTSVKIVRPPSYEQLKQVSDLAYSLIESVENLSVAFKGSQSEIERAKGILNELAESKTKMPVTYLLNGKPVCLTCKAGKLQLSVA